jgi:hypothetical protein
MMWLLWPLAWFVAFEASSIAVGACCVVISIVSYCFQGIDALPCLNASYATQADTMVVAQEGTEGSLPWRQYTSLGIKHLRGFMSTAAKQGHGAVATSAICLDGTVV